MNADKNILRSTIESGIQQALSSFGKNTNGDTLCDIYIKIDKENEKFLIYDDMENFLTEKPLEMWDDSNEETEKFEETFVKIAKPLLNELRKQNVFNQDFILKPFSISLVDDNFILMEELLFLDDDTLKLDSASLIDLNKELDNFLNDLLKDFD